MNVASVAFPFVGTPATQRLAEGVEVGGGGKLKVLQAWLLSEDAGTRLEKSKLSDKPSLLCTERRRCELWCIVRALALARIGFWLASTVSNRSCFRRSSPVGRRQDATYLHCASFARRCFLCAG